MLLALLFLSACAVPLGPGYKVVKETREIHFVPGSSARLEIRARYTLQNSGTAALPFVDIDFAEGKALGAGSLHAEWDGHEAKLAELPEEYRQDHPNGLRITFDLPWVRGQSHQLDIDYSLSSAEDSDSRITIGDDSFHLASRGWAALPQPPHHLLAPYPNRPDKMIYSVRVPSNFLVLARGKMTHRKPEGNEAEYLFQLRKNDLPLYVVGGRYVETRFHGGAGDLVFWTLHPLRENPGSSPQRITAAWATLRNDFGPIDSNVQAPHVVECPNLRPHIGDETAAAVASFPGGALVNEQTLGMGIASDNFVERVSHALAHNWFGDEMYTTGAAALAMGEGLPEYATIVTDEARDGPEARRRRIRDYLSRYDHALQQANEKPLGVTTLTDSPEQRAIALAQAPLMYVALEDVCGEAPVRNGLKNLLTLLRGQEVGFNDMRSALEQTCGKDLGEFFRQWLYSKGLPQDFRSRYELGQSGAG
jgi:Peptidase family M1 domain